MTSFLLNPQTWLCSRRAPPDQLQRKYCARCTPCDLGMQEQSLSNLCMQIWKL